MKKLRHCHPMCTAQSLSHFTDCNFLCVCYFSGLLTWILYVCDHIQYTPCPNLSEAKIPIHLNTIQINRNIFHFNHTNYYLFNVNFASFNLIYSLVSAI